MIVRGLGQGVDPATFTFTLHSQFTSLNSLCNRNVVRTKFLLFSTNALLNTA